MNYVVTGANRGIGLEFCRQLRARGDRVFAICRSPSEELRALDVTIIDDIDVTQPEHMRRLTDTLLDTSIDVLINNAGILKNDTMGDANSILAQFKTNALGPLLVTQALLGSLREGGKVAMITSRMGSLNDNTSGGYYGYRMSKAALNMGGLSLAEELRPHKIAVALLHPGYVRTDMTAQNGFIDTEESVYGLLHRIDELTLETTGGFWHTNGAKLPW